MPSPNLSERFDLAVVGAGILGLAAARLLSDDFHLLAQNIFALKFTHFGIELFTNIALNLQLFFSFQ